MKRLLVPVLLLWLSLSPGIAAPALLRLDPAQFQGRNKLINGDFSVNQRGYASGATLANGAFAHDRWLNGGGSSSYTFTQASTGEYAGSAGSPDTTITLSSSMNLMQRIPARTLSGGTYVLSWSGTATCQFGYYTSTSAVTTVKATAASPLVGTMPAGQTGYVQCTNGTLTDVQFEAGSVPTPFERRQDQLQLCQAYYQVVSASARFPATAASQYLEVTLSYAPMRATPNASLITAGSRSGNISAVAMIPTSTTQTRFSIQNNATAGDTYALGDTWALGAEF